MTQLLLEGRITQPLLGHYRSLAPRSDEDFAVALLRIGTASLDATSAAGLGNEVAGVGISTAEGPEVEIGRGGSTEVHGTKGGFSNEIKRVKVTTGENEAESWLDGIWWREWARFVFRLYVMLKVSFRMLFKAVSRRLRRETGPVSPAQPAEVERNILVSVETSPDSAASEDVYSRFLRGEALTDDEDDAYDDTRQRSRSPSTVSEDEDEDGYDSDDHDAAALYSDISKLRAKSPPLAPVLLAHMTNPDSPLTRRQYNRLLPRSDNDWSEFIQDTRSAKRGTAPFAEETDDGRRNCVICTVEPREVICWPCR